jgi:hypothetical protein
LPVAHPNKLIAGPGVYICPQDLNAANRSIAAW